MGSLPQPGAASNNGWSSVTEAGAVLKRADPTQQACIQERTSLFFDYWRNVLAEGKPAMYQSLMSKPQTRQLLTAAQGLSLAHFMGRPIPHLDNLLEEVKQHGALTGVSAHGVQSLLNYVSKTMELAAQRLVAHLRPAEGQQPAAHQAATSMTPVADAAIYAYEQDDSGGGGKGAAKAARSARAARRGGAPTPAPMAPMPPPPAVPSPVTAPPPPPLTGMGGPNAVLPGNMVIAPPPPPATGGTTSRISPSQKKSGGTKRKESSGTQAVSMAAATASTGSMPGYPSDGAPPAKRSHTTAAGTPSDGMPPAMAPTPPPLPEPAVHAGMMPMMPGATHIGPHGPSPLPVSQPLMNGMIPNPTAPMNGMIPTPSAPTMNGMVPMQPTPGMNGMVPTGPSFMPMPTSAFAANSMLPLGDMAGSGMGAGGMIPTPMNPHVPMPPLGASNPALNTAAGAATSMASLSAAPSGPLLVDNAGLMSAPSQPAWMMNMDSMLPSASTGPLPSLGFGSGAALSNPGSGAFGSLFTPGNTGSATGAQDASSLATQGASQGQGIPAGWPTAVNSQQQTSMGGTAPTAGTAAQPAQAAAASAAQQGMGQTNSSAAAQAPSSIAHASSLAALGSGELLLSTNNPWGAGADLADQQDSFQLLQPPSPVADATAMFLNPDSPLQQQPQQSAAPPASGDTATAAQQGTNTSMGGSAAAAAAAQGGGEQAPPPMPTGHAAGGIAVGEQGNVKGVGGLHNQSPTTHDAADLSS